MDIVKTENYLRETYYDLISEKENIKKEMRQIQNQYIATFGKYLIQSYRLKISCIRKKKQISFCMMKVNRNKKIYHDELTVFINTVMEQYNEDLESLQEEYRNSSKSEGISEFEYRQIKRIYRKIARKLHPDMNPSTNKDQDLFALWNRVNDAYQRNDLDLLIELEVIVNQMIGSGEDIVIDDVDQRIERLTNEIDHLKMMEPYTYKEILHSKDKKKKEKQRLKEEIRSYEDYEEKLDHELERFKIERILN